MADLQTFMDWREPSTLNIPDALRVRIGGHPLVAERLARLSGFHCVLVLRGDIPKYHDSFLPELNRVYQ